MKWLPPPSDAEVRHALRLADGRVLVLERRQSRRRSPLSRERRPTAFGTPSFQPPLMPMPPCGTAASMPTRSLASAVRQLARRERGAHRHHAAADVDADRRRHDRGLGGDHRADGGALAEVHVRHDGDVVMDERQRRDVEQLAARRVLDGHALDPGLDRRIARLDDLRAGHDAISSLVFAAVCRRRGRCGYTPSTAKWCHGPSSPSTNRGTEFRGGIRSAPLLNVRAPTRLPQ